MVVSEKFDKYGNDIKRIVFNVSDHDHAKLIVRLRHNSLTQSEFFRAVIDGVNDNDENILNFINTCVTQKQTLNKSRLKKSNVLISKGKKISSDFGFNEGEIDDIFDLIAEEHPDL
jgi:transcription termination factor NusB